MIRAHRSEQGIEPPTPQPTSAKPALDPDTVTDEQYMLRIRDRRDEHALEELIHRYQRPLYNYLVRYTGNRDRAEDVFQRTFERVFERRQQFEPGRRFKPWVFSIATHLAIDAMRKAGRHRSLELDAAADGRDSSHGSLLDLLSDDRPSPIAQLEADERRQWVRDALAALPEKPRAVILLAYYERLTLAEIADTLGIPLGTVKSRLHRGLVELNRAWKSGHRESAA